MNIGKLNVRIQIQRQAVVTDAVGNRQNEWRDYYACFATVTTAVGEGDKESETAGQTVEHGNIAFTIRACAASESITESRCRVLFRGEIYNIVQVDRMNYGHKCVKLRCKKEAR